MRRIVVDCDIPFIRGVLEPYFEVCYLKGVDFTRELIEDAVALIVRTRTHCNEALLIGSEVRAIATATIGIDHIDTDYCKSHSIAVYSSTGSNSRAVAQWVYSVLGYLGIPQGKTIGIVGVGSVGSEVESAASEFGYSVLKCDPPRAELEGSGDFIDLDTLLQSSDVVTLHTPLTSLTESMVDQSFLEKMRTGALLLNSSRGEVVDENALQSSGIRYALDVWRGEPNINIELLNGAAVGTPHIAGYSARGKARATTLAVRAIALHFDIKELIEWDCANEMPLEDLLGFDVRSYHSRLLSSTSDFEAQRTIR